jgi:hypothetical protein
MGPEDATLGEVLDEPDRRRANRTTELTLRIRRFNP